MHVRVYVCGCLQAEAAATVRSLQSQVDEKKHGTSSTSTSTSTTTTAEARQRTAREQVEEKFRSGALGKYAGTAAYDAAIDKQAKRRAEREAEEERERQRNAAVETLLLEVGDGGDDGVCLVFFLALYYLS